MILDTIEQAKSILPPDISIVLPAYTVEEVEIYLNAGIRDFGRIFIGKDPVVRKHTLTVDALESVVMDKGLRLVQRFPLKKAFIKNGIYSKKLGQVFDAYRYKIKKDGQDRAKWACRCILRNLYRLQGLSRKEGLWGMGHLMLF